jgi:transposase
VTKKRAPKTKLTPELQERITAFLRAGNYVETAAACAGIHKDTFYEWCKKGRKGEEPFATFVAAVDKAIAESEARDVALIGKAAIDNWQAAAWRLERKMPHKWGRHERHEVTGADGGAIQVKAGVVLLPPETDE